ncbi:MAG: nucleotide sugar dehydrogenase [Saprospiraceae bacterium]|nr:nucleotide sugar dehydrogenase [Saprospiraceae bacterium]
MYTHLLSKEKSLAVIGLGYVGLPIALEFARHFRVIGFDINAARIDLMRQGIDPSRELDPEAFHGTDIHFTADPADLRQATFFVVAVPTPVDEHNVPDLRPVLNASRSVGGALKKGDIVVYESTVYPGCTEEDCAPVLEAVSGLQAGVDFKLGYSPERINPGDKEHTLTKILKIVAGSDADALDTIAQVYGQIITAGIYRASSIRVAEAAKVIENTQRDINIALMNELAVIFDKMGIDTHEVLAAAGTKWNFLRFFPGLVGGHCIGVDPYYLTYKAQQYGFAPEVILSGRRINNEMPAYIAKRLTQMLIGMGKNPGECKVLILGMTFKENVADIRNSKVADLAREIMDYSINVHIVDPHASPNEVAHEYKLSILDAPSGVYDAVVVAVGHDAFKNLDAAYFKQLMPEKPLLVDIKAIYKHLEGEMTCWRL